MESFESPDKLEAKTDDRVDINTDKVDVSLLEERNTPSDVSEIDTREYVDSNAIKPSRNTDDPRFYDGGKSSQEEYAAVAENIPEVRERLAAGESIESLCADDKVGDCANAYFKEDKMLTVRDDGDGSYQLIDDGNHRLRAAQDLGYNIPVKFEED